MASKRGKDLVVRPQLVVIAVAVGAEDGAEGAVFEPARVELLVGRLVGLCRRTADGSRRCRSSSRDIPRAQSSVPREPGGAAPTNCCRHRRTTPSAPLRCWPMKAERVSRKTRLSGFVCFQRCCNAAGVLQRKDVGVLQAAADMELLIAQHRVADVRPGLLRLRAVEPESVPPLGEELAHKLVPEEVRGGGIGGVVDLRAGNLEAFLRPSACSSRRSNPSWPMPRSWRGHARRAESSARRERRCSRS